MHCENWDTYIEIMKQNIQQKNEFILQTTHD